MVKIDISERTINCGEIKISIRCHTVQIRGYDIELSQKEFAVLYLFMRHPGWVFSHSEIYNTICQNELVECKNAVRCCIWQLRKKIEYDPSNPQYIHSVRGVGYKFVVPEK